MKFILNAAGHHHAHSRDLMVKLGYTAGARLPDAGFEPREVEGVVLKCAPKSVTSDPTKPKGLRRVSTKARIYALCDGCGAWVPYGRVTQHKCPPPPWRDVILTQSQIDLLEWLSKEDYSQYGECKGPALDELLTVRFASLHRPGKHQNFIANDHAGTKGNDYRAVSLSRRGWRKLRQIRKHNRLVVHPE